MSKKKELAFLPEEVEIRFNLAPDVKISKKDKKILQLIFSLDKIDFYTLVDCLDMRPTRVDARLAKLEDLDLIGYDDELDEVFITDLGAMYCSKTKAERKEDKKFRKFLASLNDEEMDDFIGLYEDLTAPEDFEEIVTEDFESTEE